MHTFITRSVHMSSSFNLFNQKPLEEPLLEAADLKEIQEDKPYEPDVSIEMEETKREYEEDDKLSPIPISGLPSLEAKVREPEDDDYQMLDTSIELLKLSTRNSNALSYFFRVIEMGLLMWAFLATTQLRQKWMTEGQERWEKDAETYLWFLQHTQYYDNVNYHPPQWPTC